MAENTVETPCSYFLLTTVCSFIFLVKFNFAGTRTLITASCKNIVFAFFCFIFYIFQWEEGYEVTYYPIPASLQKKGIVEATKSTSIKITHTQERTGGATVGPELETHKNKEPSFPQGEGHFREKSLTPTKIFCFNEIVAKYI